jgi:protein-disulfide isomerase
MLRVEAGAVAEEADPLADRVAGLPGVDAVPQDPAAVRALEGGEDPQGGALAGAVGADQREHLPALDCEGEAVHGVADAVVGVVEVDALDLSHETLDLGDAGGRVLVPADPGYGCPRSMPKSRLSSLLGAAALSLSLVAPLLPGCQRGKAPPDAPAEQPRAGGDAKGLPAFDVSDPAGPEGRAGVPHERFFVEVGDAPTRGPADAPVTIVAFYDFECAYCERGHETIQALEELYAGKVRVAYKAFPLDFHSQALATALLVRSAHAQGKFWPLHDFLFAQEKIDLRRRDDYARAVGLDAARLTQDVESLRFAGSVARDMREGHRVGVRGTPAYFINGRALSGARPLGELRAVVDEELALAEQWRGQGVAAGSVYAHALAGAFRSVQYSQRKGPRPDLLYPVQIGASPQRGDPLAPVTVVAFTDFECPYCARGNETLEAVRRRFGAELRVVFKHLPLPFHAQAFPAARAAMAAGEQGKFWEMHDLLFAAKSLDEAGLMAMARELKLDVRRFKAAMESARFDEAIAGDLELARTIGLRGTPAYFVNGRPIGGAVGELEMSIVVQAELERAKARLAGGAAREGLYEALISSEE